MAQRKKEVIKIMDERLAELGFTFDPNVSAAGMWGFTRIVDTSWCFDYPSKSNRAVEGIFIDKDPYENELRLVLSLHSIENTGEKHFEQMGKLISDKYGHYCVPYESEKEKNTRDQMPGFKVFSEDKKIHKESFEDAVRILRDIAVDYGLDIIKDWEKNAHGGPNSKDITETLKENYDRINRTYEEKYLQGIPTEKRMEETRKLIEAQRGKRYADIGDVLVGAMANIGGRIIELYGAEWQGGGVRVKSQKHWGYAKIFLPTIVRSMWLNETGCEDRWNELAKVYVGEGDFEEFSLIVRPA